MSFVCLFFELHIHGLYVLFCVWFHLLSGMCEIHIFLVCSLTLILLAVTLIVWLFLVLDSWSVATSCNFLKELSFSLFVHLLFYRSIPSISEWKCKEECFVVLTVFIALCSFCLYTTPSKTEPSSSLKELTSSISAVFHSNL